VLVTLITATALVPLTAPLFAAIFIGPALSISPPMLAAKLFAILAGAAFIGFAGRRFVSLAAIERKRDIINGFNIIILYVFVAAVMESVGPRIITDTMTSLTFTAIAFAVFFAVLFLTFLVFLPIGRARALAIGFVVSQRNLGLMLAATGGALPEFTWLYLALSQFPLYLAPELLQPLARRILGRGAEKHQETGGGNVVRKGP
jgi:BASS family bile acid:Na+ symporter